MVEADMSGTTTLFTSSAGCAAAGACYYCKRTRTRWLDLAVEQENVPVSTSGTYDPLPQCLDAATSAMTSTVLRKRIADMPD
jgi:hypothetical protein